METRKHGFYFKAYRDYGSIKLGFVFGYDKDFQEATVFISFFCWKIMAGYDFVKREADYDQDT